MENASENKRENRENSYYSPNLKSEHDYEEYWLEEFVKLKEDIDVKACDSTFPELEESDWSSKSCEWNYFVTDESQISESAHQSERGKEVTNQQNQASTRFSFSGKTLKSSKPYLHPQHIEKRNARERKRVKDINAAFRKLREVVPSVASHSKHVSKVKTLKKAVEYIAKLQQSLLDSVHHQCEDSDTKNGATK